MIKRISIITILVIVLAAAGLLGFGIYWSLSAQPSFYTGGYVLQGESESEKYLNFDADTTYTSTRMGYVTFESESGTTTISQESFVYFDDGSVMALQGGVLLDFNDLSDNFINHYYIPANMSISSSDGGYLAYTDTGDIAFGEHMWKLSDNKYLIQADTLNVCFSEEDVRSVDGFVQIVVTETGIINILTQDNIWSTISDQCYIETEGGVSIYPVDQIIQDDTYKISLAKLTADADDNIILSADETRRQIVPELNFEAVDGEDGAEGVEGESGISGELGVDGEDGLDGISGEQGELGIEGLPGEEGQAGVAGDYGTMGTVGVTGEIGVEGTDGSSGSDGSNGSSGSDGAVGAEGTPGGTGAAGADAVNDSSTNSALPTITVSDWELSADSISGTFVVTDTAGFFSDDALGYGQYPATVKIVDNTTNEVIYCVVADSDYLVEGEGITDFTYNETLVNGGVYYFTLPTGTSLSPDSNYQLVIEAYYAMNGSIYSRTFVNETFYTDSSGVYLTKAMVTENSISLDVSVSSAYTGAVDSVVVYMMSATQSSAFVKSPASDTYYAVSGELTGWSTIGTRTITFNTDTTGNTSAYADFTSDTTYYFRVVVNYSEEYYSQTVLSDQVVTVTTLTAAPSWENDTGFPSAYFNRSTGNVEVYAPTVTDVDGSIVQYIYTVYDSTGTLVQTKTFTPQNNGVVDFTLGEGDYTFNVSIEVYNNEQTIYYDIGTTKTVTVDAGYFPAVSLVDDTIAMGDTSGGQTYWLYKGYLYISDSSTNPIDLEKGIELKISADGITTSTLTFTTSYDVGSGTGVGSVDYLGGVYSGTLYSDSNGYYVYLDFDGLLANSTYSIAVSAYLDLYETGTTSRYELNTVSFRTTDTYPLMANYSSTETQGYSFAETMSIDIIDNTLSDTGEDTVEEKLKGGQVALSLSNTSSGVTYYANLSGDQLYDAADGSGVYGTGYTVNDGTFGNISIDSSQTWRLTVTEVADESIQDYSSTGYYNVFYDVTSPSTIVSVSASLPSLTTTPNNAVTVVPVTVENCHLYTVDPDLYEGYPSDTVLGYSLTANFDNDTRVGETLTYYAYEFESFYTAVTAAGQGTFDITDADSPVTPVAEVTIDIYNTPTMPTAVFLFGNDPSSGTTGQSSSYGSNGEYVYYMGEASYDNYDYLEKGMERGWRYLFAYTVQVADYDTQYPLASLSAYEEYRTTYGTGISINNNTSKLGMGTTYMLNSGVVEAPLATPTFYSYVYETKEDIEYNNAERATYGTAVLHYYFEDMDDVITSDTEAAADTSLSPTYVTYTDQNDASASQAVEMESAQLDDTTKGWYAIDLSYKVDSYTTSKVISPAVNLSLYRKTGTAAETALGITYDDFYLAHVPVDWYWGGYTMEIQLDPSFNATVSETDNTVTFVMSESQMQGQLQNHTYALQITFSCTDNSVADKTVWTSLSLNASSQYVATVPTSTLEDFVDKGNITADITIYYDSGTQGWKLVEDSATTANTYYALQRTGKYGATDVDAFNLNDGSYVGESTSTTNGYAFGKMVESSDSSLMSSLRTVAENTTSATTAPYTTLKMNYVVTSSNATGASAEPNLYVSHYGVSNGTSTSSYYVVPKGVATQTVSSVSVGTVSNITPTLTHDTTDVYVAYSDKLMITNFDVLAYEADMTIQAKVFHQTTTGGVSPTQLGDTKTFTIDANGEFVAGTTDTGNADYDAGLDPSWDFSDAAGVSSSDREGYFYLQFYYVENGVETIMLSQNGGNASFLFEFSAVVVITPSTDSEDLYVYTSYFDKFLEMEFDLTRTTDVVPRYDIVTLDDNGEFESVVWTHDQLDEAGAFATMKDATTTLSRYNNVVKLSLSPGEIISGLDQRKEYFLRIRMYDIAYNEENDCGVSYYSFQIAAPVDLGAYVQIVNATTEELGFMVSITDDYYAIMGDKNNNDDTSSAEARGGYYSVRLVYYNESGECIQISTDYDNQVFLANDARAVFTFDADSVNATLSTDESGDVFDKNTVYYLQIYAVQDPEYDGKGPVIENAPIINDESYSEQDWVYFFGGGTISNTAEMTFVDVIDSAWTNGNPSSDYNTIYDNFILHEHGQTLIAADEIYVENDGVARSTSNSSRLAVTLYGAFNVYDATDGWAFDEINWSITPRTSGSSAGTSGFTTDADEGIDWIVEVSNDGVKDYVYELPADVVTGSYNVTVKFSKNDVVLYTVSDAAS